MQPIPISITTGIAVMLIMFGGWAIFTALFAEIKILGKVVWRGPFYREDDNGTDKESGD